MIITGSTSLSKTHSLRKKQINFGKIAIWLIITVLVADAIYSAWNGINLQTRNNCAIYRLMPHWMFLINEYLIELFMVVVAGTFIGTVAEKYFTKFRRFMPRNQVTAFIYASVIPVCSCSAVPLLESMKHRLPLRTLITFVIAAPLLNPYIIVLSFTVLGVKYAIYRIVGSFLVSIIAGMVVEWFYNYWGKPEIGIYKSCTPSGCDIVSNNIYKKTWKLIAKIAPYILIAGILGLLFELIGPVKFIEKLPFANRFSTIAIVTLIGIPIFFCNGADILFLAPLLKYTDIGMGGAIAFSLTSTAVCASSIVMLSGFLGKKLTTVLVSSIILVVLSISFIIEIV